MERRQRFTTREKWEGLSALAVGILLVVMLVLSLNRPQRSSQMHNHHPQGRVESVAGKVAGLALGIVITIGPGVAFGIALGTLRRQQLVHAVIGIFAWPVFLLAVAAIYAAFLESLWFGVLLLSLGGAALKAMLIVDRVLFRDGEYARQVGSPHV